MRHVVYSIMAIAAICLSIACQKREEVIDVPKDSVSKITVHATQADTRTAIFLDGQNYKSTWETYDSIYLLEASSTSSAYNEGRSSEIGQVQEVTDFYVDFGDQADLDGNRVYIGAYPYASAIWSTGDADDWEEAWGTTPDSPRWGLVGEIPIFQYPMPDSFDPGADLLFSKMVGPYSERPSELEMSFARVGSIAKITLKGLPVGHIVGRGRMEFGDSWLATGYAYYDPMAGEGDSKGKVALMPFGSKLTDVTNCIEFASKDIEVVEGEDGIGKAVIWLRTFSGTLSDHFAITVETYDPDSDGGPWLKFEKEVNLEAIPASIAFYEGDITEFSVAMEASRPFRFTDETIALFPELNSTNPVIRIPRDYYMYRDEELPVSFTSLANSCEVYLADMGEEEWLNLSWDNIGNYYLYKAYDYRWTTDLHTATLQIYLDNELFEIPIVEDGDYYTNLGLPLSLTLKMGDQVVTNDYVTVESGTPVTFTASFNNTPDWFGNAEVWTCWYTGNEEWLGDWPNYEYIPSPNLPISNPEVYYVNIPEITIVPGEVGYDSLCFYYYINPVNNPWLVWIENYADCYVTITGASLDDRLTGGGGTSGYNGGSFDDGSSKTL